MNNSKNIVPVWINGMDIGKVVPDKCFRSLLNRIAIVVIILIVYINKEGWIVQERVFLLKRQVLEIFRALVPGAEALRVKDKRALRAQETYKARGRLVRGNMVIIREYLLHKVVNLSQSATPSVIVLREVQVRVKVLLVVSQWTVLQVMLW